MKFSRYLVPAFLAVLFSTTVGAQLRFPIDKGGPSLSKPAAPRAEPAPDAAAKAASTPGDTVADKEANGRLAAGGWLVLLDRRDWGRSWETSSATFRTTVPLDTWMDNIPKVREGLGSLLDRVPAEMSYKTSLPGRPPGEYVTVIFLSHFQMKEVQEVVTTVREADGRWRVTGYSTR